MAAEPALEEGLRDLETQWVEVEQHLKFFWHRPSLETVEQQWRDSDTVRIFLNGCFDLMHVGHFNALRQAKSLFSQKGYRRVILVAGLHSDDAIAGQKGPPVMSHAERLAVLRATKWVDELATELPYVSMSARMADALRVDFICHGDDLTICKDGGGMYSDAIEAGRFQLLRRTEGISTTQLLERLLLRGERAAATGSGAAALRSAPATAQRLAQFAAGAHGAARPLAAAQRVVYVAGAFDMLHSGHVQLLQRAARLGDYLMVGLHSDETRRAERGESPVLTLLERAMAVLSLRPVDDVVLDAPWLVCQELLSSLNITVVATGRPACTEEDERLEVPRALGMLVEVECSSNLSAQLLKERCIARHADLVERNRDLMAKELAYVQGKAYVPEV